MLQVSGITSSDASPEKAGVGSSILPLGTIPSHPIRIAPSRRCQNICDVRPTQVYSSAIRNGVQSDDSRAEKGGSI